MLLKVRSEFPHSGTARYNIALNKVENERNDDVNFLLVLRFTLVTLGDFSAG